MSLILLTVSFRFAQSFQFAIATEGGAFAEDAGELPQAALAATMQGRRPPVAEDQLIDIHQKGTGLLRVLHKQPGLPECLKRVIQHGLPVVQFELFLEKMASAIGIDTSQLIDRRHPTETDLRR